MESTTTTTREEETFLFQLPGETQIREVVGTEMGYRNTPFGRVLIVKRSSDGLEEHILLKALIGPPHAA